MSGRSERLSVVMVASMPAESMVPFRDYERRVLALLGRHCGVLEHRWRGTDDTAEVHVLSFASRSGYEAFLKDPERAGYRTMLDGLPIEQRVIEVRPVGPDG